MASPAQARNQGAGMTAGVGDGRQLSPRRDAGLLFAHENGFAGDGGLGGEAGVEPGALVACQ